MATTLPPNRLQPTGHYRTFYDVVLPGGVSIEEALKPEYWAHVGAKLKQHDSITIFPEDGSRFVEAIVLTAGRGFANLRAVREAVLADDDTEMPEDNASLKVKWDGPHNKYVVIRRSDGEKLKTGFAAKLDAQRWLDDHLAAQAR